jgi:hypothetical protein
MVIHDDGRGVLTGYPDSEQADGNNEKQHQPKHKLF